jgi:hypothetical protein
MTQPYELLATEAAVADCRRRYAAGESGGRLAVEHGVSQPTMARAISGQTWRAATADGRHGE